MQFSPLKTRGVPLVKSHQRLHILSVLHCCLSLSLSMFPLDRKAELISSACNMNNGFSSPRHDAFPAGLRVLVVDDDSTWLRILEKMLKKCKYEVTTCCSATNALNLLREKKDGYDIVISDVNMPDMDGFKLLEHVGLEMDLPVIMMSVDGETSRVMKGVQHGACDYLLKPISMKELKNIWLHVFRKRIHEIREVEIQEGVDVSFESFIRRNGLDQSDDYHLFSGDNMSPVKKRKDLDEKDFGDSSSTKKARVVWSVDLHQKFVKAVNHIGFDKSGPKKILDLMNVPWLTRENVASHLQKYRLYLSRLQKDNDQKSSFTGVKQDSPSNDPPGSWDVKKSLNTDQNEVSIHGYQSSGCSIKSHNDNSPSHDCNVEGISSESLKEPKLSPIRNNLESHVRRTCSETRFETMDHTLTALNSWNEAPRVQLKQEDKPQHFEDLFSLLPLREKQHHIQVIVPEVPSINSTPTRRDTELVCSIDFKPLHVNFKNDQLCCLSSADMSNQEPHGQFSSSATALGGQTQGFDLSCMSDDMDYYQGNLLLGDEAISIPLEEELQYSLLYGNRNTINYGLQNIELSEYYDPGLIAEVPIYYYDILRFENWYPCDRAEYSLIDGGL